MTLNEMLTGGSFGLVLLLTLVQIAPIRCDPWGWLARTLGRAINGELIAKVDRLSEDIDRQNAKDCRTRILCFGDELRRGVPHSKEHFDQVLRDVTDYEHYCAVHPDFENEVAVITIQHLKQTYAVRLAKNDFL